MKHVIEKFLLIDLNSKLKTTSQEILCMDHYHTFWGYVIMNFTYILQDDFMDTEATVGLSKWQWSNPDKYE